MARAHARRTWQLLGPFSALFLLCFAPLAVADQYLTCPAGYVRYFQGGGALDQTPNLDNCNDVQPSPIPPQYIWSPRYPSPGPWSARVGSECDGSKYGNVIHWQGLRACGSGPDRGGQAPGDACMDATFNTDPFLWAPAAGLDAQCGSGFYVVPPDPPPAPTGPDC